MRALEKDRNRRYATALDLAADIARHLQDEPVHASPPGAVYRLRKYVRRHRVGVVAGGVIAATLVGGLGFSTWRQAHAAEREARARRGTR